MASIFLLPLLIIWGIFLIFLSVSKKKGIFFTPLEKLNFKIICVVMACVAGCFILFEDREMIFECRKDNMTCAYFHSTIANKEMRFVESYDISDLKGIDLKKLSRRKGKYSRETYYRIAFVSGKSEFELPKDFDDKHEAEKEIGSINKLIHTNAPFYRYEKKVYGDSDSDFLIVMGEMFAMMLAGIGIILLIVKWITGKRKIPDDIIHRKK